MAYDCFRISHTSPNVFEVSESHHIVNSDLVTNLN